MYFLGKDVMHPRGNQLQAYGFSKSPSKGLRGTSCYTYESEGEIIELYGSCAGFYSKQPRVSSRVDSKVVFLRRRCRFYQWLPEHRAVAGLWSQEDIIIPEPTEMLALLTPLLEWWDSYEQWIEERFGEQYREKCYAEWNKVNKSRAWLPPQLAREWIQGLLSQKASHVRPKHLV